MAETDHAIICTNCLIKGDYIDAVKYCVDCNENMCKPCLRHHIKAHSSSSHKLIGRDEIPDWMKTPVENRDETCARHPDDIVNKLCEDHDALCCEKCEELEHGSCKKVVPIKEAICNHEAKCTRIEQAKKLQQLAKDLQQERKQCREKQTSVRKSTASSLAAVRTIKEKAIKLFEELEKKAMDEINSECIDKDNDIQAGISSIDKIATLIDISLKQLETGCDSNLQFLLQIQRSQRIRSDSEHILDKIRTKCAADLKQEFKVNPHIEVFLEKLTSLGNIGLVRKQHLQLTPKNDIDIRLSTDMYKCNIKCISISGDGAIVLTDSENEKVKCLSSSLELNEDCWLHMCSSPFAVCNVGQDEVAVSLPSIKQVQYLSLGPDIVVDGCIHMDEYCRGLAYSYLYDELYVGCGGGPMPGEGLGQIRVYRKSELIRTFKTCQRRRPICTFPLHLAISTDGTLIYVTDSEKGLITMNRQGHILSTLTPHELEEAHGVCVDINDNVIVCGRKSNNVIMIMNAGKDYKVLLGEDDGILHPTDVCYDVRSAMLFVSNGASDTVKGFCTK